MPKAGVGMKATPKKGRSDKHPRKDTLLEKEFTLQEGRRPHTDVLEVWFAGCHTGGFMVRCITRTRVFVDVSTD